MEEEETLHRISEAQLRSTDIPEAIKFPPEVIIDWLTEFAQKRRRQPLFYANNR